MTAPLLRASITDSALPGIILATAILSVWTNCLDPTTEWLNRLIPQPLGLSRYVGSGSKAGYALLLTMSAPWSIGPGLLITVGALQDVPQERYGDTKALDHTR